MAVVVKGQDGSSSSSRRVGQMEGRDGTFGTEEKGGRFRWNVMKSGATGKRSERRGHTGVGDMRKGGTGRWDGRHGRKAVGW